MAPGVGPFLAPKCLNKTEVGDPGLLSPLVWKCSLFCMVSFAWRSSYLQIKVGNRQLRCPSDQDINWMSPMQGKSLLVQVEEPYGNLDMITCRLSSCNTECTKYTCR